MLNKEIEHFINYCTLSDFSKKSIETFSLRLSEFNTFINTEAVGSISDILYVHLRKFVADHEKPSIHIKKARIWALRQFFHFLKLEGKIDENIATTIPYPKIEKTVPQFLTIDELNEILSLFYQKTKDNDVLAYRNLSIIMILGFLGLRISSIIRLNIENIDIESGLIFVREKGRKHREIVIPKVICKVLSQYLKYLHLMEGPLFLSKRNKRISDRSIQNIFRQAADQLGIDKRLHAHLFRHTAATHLNKVSDQVITQHVLGHSHRKNTEKYTHLNPDQYAVYMKLHPYMN